jgi:signal transduction histidine kinase
VSDRSAAEATGVAWQVLDATGTVLDRGGPASAAPMVDARQLALVGSVSRTFGDGDLLPPISHAPYRLRVTSVSTAPRTYLLVGVRRDHRDEALRELLAQLVVAGLGALVVTAFVGERLARAALRPVERYRRSAAAIAEGAVELRLEVPADRDDEVTRLGHTLNDMLASLERSLERERQFVNEASHELRTPITLLSSRLQLARRRPRTQAEHERILQELQVDLDRLARLTAQLLDLGGVAAGGRRGRCNVAAVTARVIEQRRLVADATPGAVTTDLPAEAVWADVPEFEVERILTNLLDNAATHGAPPFGVTVDRPSPSWVRLGVADAGPGMPPELLDTATRRFTRAEDARSRPGAGLGLALVQALVVQSGGELRLCHEGHHSSHGRPAPVACGHGPEMTVTVLLPASAASGPARDVIRTVRPPAPPDDVPGTAPAMVV